VTISEKLSALIKIEGLYELLKSLKGKEICLEIEGRMYRGDLVCLISPEKPL